MTRVLRVLVMASVLFGPVLGVLTFEPARAAVPGTDCGPARELVAAHLIDDAVSSFAAAKKEGLPCGSGAEALDAIDKQSQAKQLVVQAQALEAKGDRGGAVGRYTMALEIDRQQADALAALRRLAGVATAPDSSTTTMIDEFAGAKALDDAGRTDEARAAALKAIADTGKVPTDADLKNLVKVSGWDHFTKWVTDYWTWAALALLIAVFLEGIIIRTRPVRQLLGKYSRMRIVVDVQDKTGATPDLSAAFAVLLQDRMTWQSEKPIGAARSELNEPQWILAPDAPIDLPDFSQAPSQAKWLIDLWRWNAKRANVTLSVVLLPATAKGVSCRVALRESTGKLVKATPPLERVILCRQPAATWTFPPGDKGVDKYLWQSLVPIVQAWSTFCLRSLWVTRKTLAMEMGTSSQEAYSLFLTGIEEMTTDLAASVTDFTQAIKASGDEKFPEAQLNLCYALTALGRVDEAEERLGDWARDLESPDDERSQALRLRCDYSQLVILANRATTTLSKSSGAVQTMTQAVGKMLDQAKQLAGGVEEAFTDTTRKTQPGLYAIAERMKAHSDLLLAGSLDLDGKLKAYKANGGQGFPGLPLADADGGGAAPEDVAVEEIAAEKADADDVAPAADSGEEPDRYPNEVMIKTLDKYRPMPRAADVSYALACLWARDARLRAMDEDKAIDRVVEYLTNAIDDEEDDYFRTGWSGDPDLADLKEKLTQHGCRRRGAQLPRRDRWDNRRTRARRLGPSWGRRSRQRCHFGHRNYVIKPFRSERELTRHA